MKPFYALLKLTGLAADNFIFRIAAIAIAFYFLSGWQACKKTNPAAPQLPPITQEGKNTFGCKITNGDIWVPYWPCNQFTLGAVEIRDNIYSVNPPSALPLYINLNFGNVSGDGSGFTFAPKGNNNDFRISKTGNILDSLDIGFIGQPTGTASSFFYNFPHILPTQDYFTITKIDTVNKIFSGIFSFTLYSQGKKDSIQFTDGRFDLQIGEYEHCTD